MGFCKDFSKCYLVLLNSIFGLAGLAIASVGTYVLVAHTSLDIVRDAFPRPQLIAVTIFGAIITLVCIWGCTAASKGKQGRGKCMLFTYIIVLLAVVAAQTFAGITVTQWAGISHLKETITTDSNQKLGMWVDCSYQTCCDGAGSTTPSTSCNAEQLAKFKTDVGTSFCTDARKIDIIPATATDAQCSTRDQFQQFVIDYLNKHLKTIGIACIVLGTLELLAVGFAAKLMCARKPEKRRPLSDQEAGYPVAYQTGMEGAPRQAGQPVSYA